MLTHDNLEHELAWLEHDLRSNPSAAAREKSFHAVSRRLAGCALAGELGFLDMRLAALRRLYAISETEQEKPSARRRP